MQFHWKNKETLIFYTIVSDNNLLDQCICMLLFVVFLLL